MAPQPDQSHDLALELQDGYVCFGNSFGADKSISGELVFQTGMVGYPESITDPSYRGQILVITFPLVGNYGVPSREEMDSLLEGIPAHFESNEIHIAGLVVATYAGEEYSHHLATSSLGAWLKEQGVPAITGVDTRALTKRIREEGSMLGRLMQRTGPSPSSTSLTNGAVNTQTLADDEVDWRSSFEQIEWLDPNKKNLVAEGIGDACPHRHLP
jgi:carbamoyl-phosphate synthase/aspartate carbamoyltransferase